MQICVKCGEANEFRLNRAGGTTYRTTCIPCENARKHVSKSAPRAAPPGSSVDPDLVKLVSLAKKSIGFEDLCNKMGLSPQRTKDLLQKAKERNAPIHVEHDTISIAPSPALEQVRDIMITGKAGPRRKVGAISDTHLGSKYCLRGALRETIQWMYDDGVRDILHSGDVLEGCYRHSHYEVSHNGFDAQMDDAAKCFPELKGLRYHFISGNHDYTFEEKIGMRAGASIAEGFQARGRSDWNVYGDRNAYIRIHGAVINLYHPGGGMAYARSYNLQKKIEGYSAIKPQILLMGHYHQFCYAYERGIHGIMMPCFQGSGSNFAQSLKGPPSIGGIIIDWQLSETGRIYDLQINPRFYFEKDDIFTPRNELDAQEIHPVGREKRYRKQPRE